MKVHVLGSGSAGNLTVLETNDGLLLVDIGFSAKQSELRLAAAGLQIPDIHAIVVTHEHEDHIRGARVFANRHEIPVYTNALTAERLRASGKAPDALRVFGNGIPFPLGPFLIEAFSVCHDAVDPVGFRIASNGQCAAIATDLGHLGKMVPRKLQDADVVVLESNYDPELLRQCSRPPRIIQRIRSKRGHLDNETAVACIAEVAGTRLREVIFAHLSEECNNRELLDDLVQAQIPSQVRVQIARQNAATSIEL